MKTKLNTEVVQLKEEFVTKKEASNYLKDSQPRLYSNTYTVASTIVRMITKKNSKPKMQEQ